MEGNASIIEYDKIIGTLTAKTKRGNPIKYYLGIYVGVSLEFEKGYYATKVYKPNKDGTKIRFKPFKDEKQVEVVFNFLMEILKGLSGYDFQKAIELDIFPCEDLDLDELIYSYKLD